jgi:hypothetical protein
MILSQSLYSSYTEICVRYLSVLLIGKSIEVSIVDEKSMYVSGMDVCYR